MAPASGLSYLSRTHHVVLPNPYQPPTAHHETRTWSASGHQTFAGCWLAAAGLIHFAVVNSLAGRISLASIEWTPMILTAVGVLILFRFRSAMAVARLVGSFVIFGLCMATVVLVGGFADGGELTNGDATNTDRGPWQVFLLMVVIGVTVIPPWWSLQRALTSDRNAQKIRPSDEL